MRSADSVIAPRPDVPLAPLSTLQVGGPARWFVPAADVDAVAAAHRWCAARGMPMLVLGGGSNVVIADGGVDGLVLQMDVRGIDVTCEGGDTLVRVGAGEPWDPVVADVVSRGLAGLECLSGIPGRTGGTPIQNVGAYGQEVAAAIEEVEVYDRVTADAAIVPAAACGFAYRTSRFKHEDAGRFVVCRVTFRLRPGEPTLTYPDLVAWSRAAGLTTPALGEVREAVLQIRRHKGMVLDETDPDTRSVGSFFMNPRLPVADCERMASQTGVPPPSFAAGEGQVKVPAAWLIERAGFGRGAGDGPVGLSTKHPLAIVNRGGATARDIVRFAARVARAVHDRFGVRLRPEPVFIGFDDDPEVGWLCHVHASD